MTEKEKAVKLMRDLMDAEVTLAKAFYGNGRTKTAEAQEVRCVRSLFKALTGSLPTAEELERVIPK